MKWKLPQYSGKDYVVLAFFVGPFSIGINTLLLGVRYFADGWVFLTATGFAAIDFCIGFTFCSAIGVGLRKFFKGEQGIGARLLVMIFIFLILTIVFLIILFWGYEHIPFFHYSFDSLSFAWACIGTGIYVVFITFLLEGMARYRIWKNKMTENEQLSRANRQIRLQGLKSQVNPHFLFNSLNSLSSLVDEDEDKAEKFLDELSKVYRYMLRTEDDELVTLDAELAFTGSYYYLLKARYGEGLEMKINVCHNDLEKYLPPLTLQTIIENAFMQNSMTRESPLIIRVESNDEYLIITNNLQPKIVGEDRDVESGIDNLVARYSLLHHSAIIIHDDAVARTIRLPLFDSKNETAV